MKLLLWFLLTAALASAWLHFYDGATGHPARKEDAMRAKTVIEGIQILPVPGDETAKTGGF